MPPAIRIVGASHERQGDIVTIAQRRHELNDVPTRAGRTLRDRGDVDCDTQFT
jgi:hypothetical protein